MGSCAAAITQALLVRDVRAGCGAAVPARQPVAQLPDRGTRTSPSRWPPGHCWLGRSEPRSCPSQPTGGQAQLMRGILFPQLSARDLDGQEAMPPAGVPGEWNVVVIPFRRQQEEAAAATDGPNGPIPGTSSRSSRQTPRQVPVPEDRTWSARVSRGYAGLPASGDEDTAPA